MSAELAVMRAFLVTGIYEKYFKLGDIQMGLFSKTTASGIEYLIVGLGNPDKKYENTRHNAGFMALDKIAEDCGASVDRVKFKALTGKTEIGGKKCLLMKPLTYMNLSGESVAAAMRFYKVPLERVVVFYDDISLEPSFLRIRRKGSDGGHNGIKNIILMAGGDTFPRVKIGVGKKPHPDYDLADWVLSSFSQKEKKELSQALEHCPDIAFLIVNGQIDKAMNQYNS